MHIAYWSPAWPIERFHNGIVTYVHWMKVELERQGHRVTVFTEGEEYSPSANVNFVRLGVRDRVMRRVSRLWQPNEFWVFDYAAAIAREILRVHRRDRIDILETEESYGWFAEIARRTSIPLLVKLHGPAFLSLVEHERETQFGQEKIEREGRALHAAKWIVSPSVSTLSQTLTRYGLAQKAVRHIVNPVSMARGAPLWDVRACDPNVVLFVGRFDLRKGGDVMLKAFLLVLREHPEARLIFVGPDRGVPDADGGLLNFQTYRDRIFPAELRNRIEYRGHLPNDEVARLRAQAMVTVVASRWENQGYALLEAMLQGCPVVSTDAGGCSESVTHGETGLLARSEDPSDFAMHICQFLGDRNLASSMGRAARGQVREVHSAERVAAMTLDGYRDAIGSIATG